MHRRTIAAAAALMIALSFGAGQALAAGANAHGQCKDGSGNGGGGSVGTGSGNGPGPADTVTVTEVQSVAEGLATFAQGAIANGPGSACQADDDPNDDGTEDNEDHIAASASHGGSELVGVCYDNEGFHATAQCHGGGAGLP